MNLISLVVTEGNFITPSMYWHKTEEHLFDPPIVTDSDHVETLAAVVTAAITERVYDREPVLEQ